MIKLIALNALLPHPATSSKMSMIRLKKLKNIILDLGQYEPITVCPHPNMKNKYNILNGHQRVKILKELGKEKIYCNIWDIDSKQALLFLATLNSLAGSEIKELRMLLLENLINDFDINKLSKYLPENKKTLENILHLKECSSESLSIKDEKCKVREITENQVVLSFVISIEEYDIIQKALETAKKVIGITNDNKAIKHICKEYLEGKTVKKKLINKKKQKISKNNAA